MQHLLSEIDETREEGLCSECGYRVDVYRYQRKGRFFWRCGPRAREYRREHYEQMNPDARTNRKHTHEIAEKLRKNGFTKAAEFIDSDVT